LAWNYKLRDGRVKVMLRRLWEEDIEVGAGNKLANK
jgi:hypothetical protein